MAERSALASGLIAWINRGKRSVPAASVLIPTEAEALTSKSDSRFGYHASRTRPSAILCARTWYSESSSQLAPMVTLADWFTDNAGKGEGSAAVARGLATARRFA